MIIPSLVERAIYDYLMLLDRPTELNAQITTTYLLPYCEHFLKFQYITPLARFIAQNI